MSQQPEQNKTAEQISKEEAEKLYPVITTHNWYAKENAAYRNGFERAFEIASQQTASLQKQVEELKRYNNKILMDSIGQHERIAQLEKQVEELTRERDEIQYHFNSHDAEIERLEKQVEELTRQIEAVKDRCADEMSNFVPVKDILKVLTSENQKQ